MVANRPVSGAPPLAPPNLTLAIRRLAGLLGARGVGIVGPASLALGDGLDVVHSATLDNATREAGRDGLLVLTGAAPWDELGDARIVLAADLGAVGPAIDRVAVTHAAAAAAGWHVVYTGLLHTSADGGARREGSLLLACRAEDPLVDTLACGPLGLALDPLVVGEVIEERPARVLIASYEVAGPTGNGGIGTAYHSLAHVLADAGHDVTLLFTGWLDPEQARDEGDWRRRFAERGIDFSLLGTPWDVPVRNPHHQARRAYELHRWLSEAHGTRPFDVVHVPECLGHGAYAQTAKHLGIAYDGLEFVVGTHSSTRWVAESNREGIEGLDQLVTEQLERTSVALADVVMSPTAYLLDYMRDRDWTLPARTFVQALARPRSVRELADDQPTARDATTARELVFFGRLETRKGLEAFCDAVDALTADGDCPFDRVTLLGRPERVVGEEATSYVARRADDWGLEWEILADRGHDEAVAYLRERSCVVAIPSLVDNSPNTVIETVALGVPSVVSRSGGTGELIATADLASSTFDGWSNASTLEPPTFSETQDPFDVQALVAALRTQAAALTAPISPSVEDAACDRVYDRWHRAIAGRRRAARVAAPTPPLTAAVCILARSGEDAAGAAAAIAAGTRRPERILAIVEQPSATPVPGLDVIVAPGREAGPARRRVNAELDADVLIVLRGNELPDPMLVERVLSAMRDGESDVLSLVTRDHDRDRPTDTPDHLRRRGLPRDLCAFVPIAGPALAGALYQALSVGPYAIRRSAVKALGGYAADTWGEAVDRELLARAALAGLRIDVFPDPLATVVKDDCWVELRTRYWGFAAVPAPEGEEQIRLLRPFRRELEGPLADLPALLVGTLRVASRAAERTLVEEQRREHTVDTYETRIGEFQQLVDVYENQLTEHRDLIALYEQQKEEMRAALATSGGNRPGPESTGRMLAWRVRDRLRRATRGPVSAWPGRGVRFARSRVQRLRQSLR